MAVLSGMTRDRGTWKPIETHLELEPVMPSLDGPRDAYRVRIGPNEESHVFESVLILEGYQSVHETFKYFAEMMSEAGALLELQCKDLTAAVAMHYSLWWADFWISYAASPRHPLDINLDVYVYDENEESSPQNGFVGDRCTVFGFRTTAEEAMRFGNDLMRELVVARNRRRELGLDAQDEE